MERKFWDPIKFIESLITRFIPPLPGNFILVTFQYVMLAVTFVTLLMWVSQGFDSTLHWFAYEHNFANPPEDAYGIDYFEGIGIHWSTLATIGFCALQLSLYLKTRLDIDGIINVLYSLLIGWWVAMMVFEVPYVFAMDILHNNNYEALPWDIWLAGYKTIYYGAGGTAGRDAVRWFVIASLLFPTQGMAGYVILVRRYLGGMYNSIGLKFTRIFFYGSTLLVGILVWFITAQALSPYLFPVIIRNFTWLFGFILSHGLLIYEFERPNREGNPRAFTYRFKEPVALILLGLMVGGWLLWIYYPGTFPIIKGSIFPQTVYAFYDDTHRVITNQVWIEDNVIHGINVALKCIVAAWTCYVFAPKLAPLVTAGTSDLETVHPHNPPFFGLDLSDSDTVEIDLYLEDIEGSKEIKAEIDRITNDPEIAAEVERIKNDPQIAAELERIREWNDSVHEPTPNDEYLSDTSGIAEQCVSPKRHGIVDAREDRDRQVTKQKTQGHAPKTHLRETNDTIPKLSEESQSRTEKEVIKGLVTSVSFFRRGFIGIPLRGRPENRVCGQTRLPRDLSPPLAISVWDSANSRGLRWRLT